MMVEEYHPRTPVRPANIPNPFCQVFHPQKPPEVLYLRSHDGLSLVVLLAVMSDADGLDAVAIYLPVTLRRRLLSCLRRSKLSLYQSPVHQYQSQGL